MLKQKNSNIWKHMLKKVFVHSMWGIETLKSQKMATYVFQVRQVNLILKNEASNAAGEWDQYTIHLKSHVLGYRLLK